jgi:hypothetical protein
VPQYMPFRLVVKIQYSYYRPSQNNQKCGTTRNLEKRFRSGAKQEIVDDLFVLQCQWR